MRCSPEKALLGMAIKHFVSIIDIVEDLDKGIIPSHGILDDKVTDILNYIVLLEALIKERLEG